MSIKWHLFLLIYSLIHSIFGTGIGFQASYVTNHVFISACKNPIMNMHRENSFIMSLCTDSVWC